jgi:hypothetical protein
MDTVKNRAASRAVKWGYWNEEGSKYRPALYSIIGLKRINYIEYPGKASNTTNSPDNING